MPLSIHRAASGTYPARLDDLVPALLNRVPIDDFSEQPLKYARSADGGFTLYSFGRNRIDNQGRSTDPLADTKSTKKRESAQANDENGSDIEPELYDDDADDLVIRIEGKRKS